MSINLQKKGTINLSKGGLEKLKLDLKWDSTKVIDVDASAFVCKTVGDSPKVLSDNHIVYFGNLKTPNGAVRSLGDERSGGGDGETILVDLSSVESEVTEIDIFLTIYESKQKKLDFGSLSSGSVSVVNESTGAEVASFSFGTGEYDKESVIQVINVYRTDNGWETQAIGDGRPGLDLGDIVNQYR